MKKDILLTDFLKLIRTVKSQIQIIKDLEISQEEKKIIDAALSELRKDLEKKDSQLTNLLESIKFLKSQIQAVKRFELSQEEKETLENALNELKEPQGAF